MGERLLGWSKTVELVGRRLDRAIPSVRLRRASLALVILTLALLVALSQREAIRRTIAETIDLEFKHQLISDYSLLTSQPHDTADFAPVAHADVRPYGINVFFEQEVEEAKIRRSLEMIRAAGFGWIKQQVVWSEIETPTKGYYGTGGENWAKYDRIVRLAREYGLDVVFRVDTSPKWARPTGKEDKLETPPKDFSDYGDFLATIVGRYRGQVRYYQVWNEPNLAFEWGGEYPSPAGYARLLTTAYLRAKETDPNAVIILGALAPTLEMTERGLSDVYYLDALYEADARNYFDIVSVNAYGLRAGPDDFRLDTERDVNFSRPILVREVMVAHGDAGKPIWAAEVGWCALPPNFGEEPRYGTVTRDQQARYTVRAYQRVQEEWPWLGGMALWHFRLVNPNDVIQQHYYFNAVDEQFGPYPVYTAMSALANGPATIGRGYHQESHWAVARGAGWRVARDDRASLGQLITSADPSQEYRFAFEGTSLDLVVPRGPSLGGLAVMVDGRADLANQLPRSGEIALLDERAASEEWQIRVPVARDLSDDRHLVIVRPFEASATAGIDGFVVDGPTPRDRLIRRISGIAVGVGGGLVLLVGTSALIWRRGRSRRGGGPS